jgi:tetratricopeptide (TPR) repeat protein
MNADTPAGAAPGHRHSEVRLRRARWWFVIALAALGGARAHAQVPAPPPPPVLLIPARPDSTIVETPEAPLLVPGRVAPDSGRTRAQRAREYVALGEALEKEGRAIAAVAAYRNAFLLDSTITGPALRAGRILAALGDDPTAVNMFATEVARNPRDPVAARELGLALSRVGEHAHALDQLERLVRQRPDDDECWSALGVARLAAGRPAGADSAFRRALALPPERASEHRDLAAALAALGRADEARAGYRRAIKMDPHDATAWVDYGNLERDAGHLETALGHYREAEKRDSSLAAAIQGQARTLQTLGRAREAGEAYRRWVTASPFDLGARLEAVNHFLSEGRADIALAIARDALRIDARSPDAHLLCGVSLDATGHTREALGELRRAESLYASDTGKTRARELIAKLRAAAPDSLRGLFEADSARHAAPR